MYARHGYYFKDDTLRSQFARFPWYHPIQNLTMDGAEASFSDIEMINLKELAKAKSEAHH